MDEKEKIITGMSRRSFLKTGAVAAAGVAMSGLLTACGKGRTKEEKEAAKVGSFKSAEPSFLKAPAPIADGEIKSTLEADVVIVGAGMAGLCAAVSAAEAGQKVIVIEKTNQVNFRGYDYGAIDSKAQQQAGSVIDKTEAVREIMRFGGYKADQRVVEKWVNESGKVNDWLFDMAMKAGCTVKRIWNPEEITAPNATVKQFPTMTFVLEPPEQALQEAPKGLIGGKPVIAMAWTLLKTAMEKGVEIRYATPAVQLIRSNNEGRITGVIAKDKSGYIKLNTKNGVILCAGDYGHNQEMVDYYVPSYANCKSMVNVYPSEANQGDGQQMGIWVGARIDEGPHAAMYFDIAMMDAPGLADSLMRQPWLSVNMNGDRYANEDLPYAYISNAVRQQPGDQSRWTIWDSKWPEEAPAMRQTACKSLKSEYHSEQQVKEFIEKGIIKSANTVEELAEKMNLPVDKIKSAVARYNDLAAKGVDEDFRKRKECLTPIIKPPFYGAHLKTALLVTLGGLTINENMQVLDKESKIIPGLYAAGNNSGSFYHYDYCVTFSGQSHGRAQTFGYLAGKNVKEMK